MRSRARLCGWRAVAEWGALGTAGAGGAACALSVAASAVCADAWSEDAQGGAAPVRDSLLPALPAQTGGGRAIRYAGRYSCQRDALERLRWGQLRPGNGGAAREAREHREPGGGR